MGKNCDNSWLCGRHSGSVACRDIGVASIRVRRFEMSYLGEIIHLHDAWLEGMLLIPTLRLGIVGIHKVK